MWIEATLGAAFLAGLAGGAHCAAMCGGLVGIACGARAPDMSRGAWWGRALAYNGGRIASYVAAGALTGAIGAVLGCVPRLVRSRASRALFAAVIMSVGAFGIAKSIQPMAHAGVHAPGPTPSRSP